MEEFSLNCLMQLLNNIKVVSISLWAWCTHFEVCPNWVIMCMQDVMSVNLSKLMEELGATSNNQDWYKWFIPT